MNQKKAKKLRKEAREEARDVVRSKYTAEYNLYMERARRGARIWFFFGISSWVINIIIYMVVFYVR